MKINKVRVLIILVIIEAIIIILIITRGAHVVVRVREVGTSPLVQALNDEASDKRFEELVKQYPQMVNYRLPSPGSHSILASCAILNRTNYAKILIANGADVKEAVAALEKVGAEEAVKLIQDLATNTIPPP